MKNRLLGRTNTKPTTVCRGFAHFLTNLASRWGFEAYSVVVKHRNMGHVVTMFRKPGSTFRFVDGDPYISTNARTLLEAAQSYILKEGSPPQLDFLFYDADGEFERYIETNEGRILRESITMPEVIGPYLRFRN